MRCGTKKNIPAKTFRRVRDRELVHIFHCFCLQLKWVYEVHKNKEELLENFSLIKSINFDLGAVLGELLELLLVMWSSKY
jgi:hypothetical protein